MKPRSVLTIALAVLIAVLPAGLTALEAQQPAGSTPAANSKLVGKVLGADGKPIAGARIVAYHLSTEQSFTSEPTGSGGEYQLPQLPYGYFDLAVETPDGVFVGSQVVNIAPNGTASVTFTLAPHTGASSPREFPGIEQPPDGVARVTEKLKGRDFWRSSKGVAIIAASGGAVLLAIAGGDGSDGDAAEGSPFVP